LNLYINCCGFPFVSTTFKSILPYGLKVMILSLVVLITRFVTFVLGL
jgi:hypothetical protein